MPLFHLVFLAILQGITEFLPISSSGHLILVPTLSGWEDQGLLIDVAVHVGTLAAVCLYFWRDVRGLALAGLGSVGVAPARRAVADTLYIKLFWGLVLATLPVVMLGLALTALDVMDLMRRADLIAATSIVFGLALYWADQRFPAEKRLAEMKLKPALQIGLAQMLALIPGTSRSGITMTAGRMLGFSRTEAARFSMLLSIPTILAAGSLSAIELAQDGAAGAWRDAAIAAGLACLAALAAIHFLMRWLRHASMTIFVAYRVALGIGLFVWVV